MRLRGESAGTGEGDDGVRHTGVLVIAAVTLVVVAGCADRPNDLDTYYDESPPEHTAPAPAAPRQQAPPAPPSDPELSGAMSLALLGSRDVAAEGVSPGGEPAADACLASVPKGTMPEQRVTWEYPSGSVLSHQISGYRDREADSVLREIRCPGERRPVKPVDHFDDAKSWCAESTCTVLLARGRVLSVLQVTGSTPQRAVQAAERLTPVQKKALTRQP